MLVAINRTFEHHRFYVQGCDELVVDCWLRRPNPYRLRRDMILSDKPSESIRSTILSPTDEWKYHHGLGPGKLIGMGRGRKRVLIVRVSATREFLGKSFMLRRVRLEPNFPPSTIEGSQLLRLELGIGIMEHFISLTGYHLRSISLMLEVSVMTAESLLFWLPYRTRILF